MFFVAGYNHVITVLGCTDELKHAFEVRPLGVQGTKHILLVVRNNLCNMAIKYIKAPFDLGGTIFLSENIGYVCE